MAINPLVKKFELSPDDLEKQVQDAMSPVTGGDGDTGSMEKVYNESVKNFELDSILPGRIVNIVNDDAIIDVGYKSEGIIPLDQFENPEEVKKGDEVEVLLEAVEDAEGIIAISKRKADRLRSWERVISTYKEGDVVRGKVTRKIKGGLLVEIGVPVFLPASQISIRRSGDISEFIGQDIECKIIKIDEARMNIVVSRRKLIEEQREAQKKKLLEDIQIGQIRRGAVKNITDFGAFVDLGGLDGLLHITDMSWGRISHPSEILSIDDEIEVKVLKVDKEKERISLGLKQKEESPWANIEQKYPVGSRINGKVVNVLSYGAFVQLEPGVEGLVHISEMSWTKRINHPNQVVSIGDEIEVVVLEIKKEKQEISLGMKQVEVNPWTLVQEKYPVGTIVEGKVRNLTNYGAFVELEDGIDGLLHVADMSWTRKVSHPSEVVKKGETIKAMVLQVDQERKRIALGVKQLEEDPWTDEIPSRYEPGKIIVGSVTKITNFGVFVELESDLEGLLHISELSERKVGSPEEVVKVGEKLAIKVIKVDPENRKIGLSLKEVDEEERDAAFDDGSETPAEASGEGAGEASGERAAAEGAVSPSAEGSEGSEAAARNGGAPGAPAGDGEGESSGTEEERPSGEAGTESSDEPSSGSTEEPSSGSTEEPSSGSTEEPSSGSTEEPSDEKTSAPVESRPGE